MQTTEGRQENQAWDYATKRAPVMPPDIYYHPLRSEDEPMLVKAHEEMGEIMCFGQKFHVHSYEISIRIVKTLEGHFPVREARFRLSPCGPITQPKWWTSWGIERVPRDTFDD